MREEGGRPDASRAAACLAPRYAIAVLLLALAPLLVPAPLLAADQPRAVFSQARFDRTGGAPDVYDRTFSVPAYVGGPFALHILNGNPDGSARVAIEDAVSSGRVLVDGVEVVAPSAFSKTTPTIDRTLALTPGAHSLRVELASAPGSYLRLSITGVIPLGDLTQPRAGHSATLLPDGRVLLAGGGSGAEPLATTERFDGVALQSQPLNLSLLTARRHHRVTLLPDASFLVTGGADAVGPLAAAEHLRRDLGAADPLPAGRHQARAGHSATLLPDGRVLLLGGLDVSHFPLAEGERFDARPDPLSGALYDPQSGSVTPLPDALLVPRTGHTATLLPSGLVLVAGGRNGEGDLASAELFDPATGHSTLLAAPLTVPRSGHAALLQPDGAVLLLGGRQGGGFLGSMELFLPAPQAFAPVAATLLVPRAHHTATRLPSGEILVAGGEGAAGVLAHTELAGPPPPDAVPPQVQAVSPAPDALLVPRNPLVTVLLSEPLLATSVTPGTVTLSGPGGPVPALVAPAEEGWLLALTPTVRLEPGTTYTLSLTGLTDVAGNPLPTTTSRFTTFPLPILTHFTPTSGPPGTTVTLTGQHLGLDPAHLRVMVGGLPAVVTGATATAVTIAMPETAQSGLLTVTTPGGTATSAQPFTVVRGPAIAALAPASGPVGTTVTLSGQGFDPVAANNQVRFNGLPAIGQAALAVALTGTGGFTTLATISVAGAPAGMAASVAMPSITTGQQTLLTVTANGTTPAGLYTLTVQAVGLVNGVPTVRAVPVGVQVGGAGATTLAGQVRDEEDRPVRGALVKLGALQVVTDEGGNFLFENPPAGADQLLLIDGGPASTPAHNLPVIPLKATVVAGAANALSFVPRLHFQKTTGLVEIGNSAVERVVTDPELPGFSMTLPAGATITGWDGQPNTRISVRRVPLDRIPLPPPPTDGVTGAVYMDYFGKPGGGTPSEAIPVSLPNDLDLPPETPVELWYFDEAPDGSRPNRWAQYGTGTVSADGIRIVPDIDPATGKPYGQPRFCCGANLVFIRQAIFNSVFDAPAAGPEKDEKGGDPVDLATGLFTLERTDVVLPARLPIALTRTYRTQGPPNGPFGRGTAHAYNILVGQRADQRILRLPDGRRFTFTLQTDGSYRNLTDGFLQGAVLTEPGGLPALRWKDGGVWTFGVSSSLAIGSFELTQMADRNGNTVTLTRSSGLITAITASDGRALTLEYEGGRIARVGDPLGRTWLYAYDAAGNLVTVTDPEHGVTRYSYDAEHRMTAITDARGITYLQNFYGPSGRVLRQVQADGGEWRLHYQTSGATVTGPCTTSGGTTVTLPVTPCPTVDSWDNVQAGFTLRGGSVTATTVVDPRGFAATTRFTPRGYAISRTDRTGQTTVTQRTAANQVRAATDSLGRTTAYEYDAAGNVTKVTDPEGRITRFEYEPSFNRVTTITDALGQVTEFTYDARGNLLTTKDPLGHVTTMSYDEFGQVASVTDPLGHTTTFAYDASGNLAATTDPLGHATLRAYDAVSRLTALADPRGLVTQFRYDGLNRVTEIADARHGITRFAYDGNGNLLASRTPRARRRATPTIRWTGSRPGPTRWAGRNRTSTTRRGTSRRSQIARGRRAPSALTP